MVRFEQEYQRFLIDAVHEIFRNRTRCNGKYFNVFVKDGQFKVKLQDVTFVDLLARAEQIEEIIDPLHSLSGTEIHKLFGFPEKDIPDYEYNEFLEDTISEIKDYIIEDIPYTLFEKWIEFY